MDLGDVVVKPVKDFAKNSARLVKRCTKPDRKGVWQQVARFPALFTPVEMLGT